MILNSKTLLGNSRKEANFWLNEEIMSSLTHEMIDRGKKEVDGETHIEYDVKLVINGIETDPKLLQKIISGIERIVDEEAEKVASEKLGEALREVDMLHEIIKEAEQKIRDKFNIQKEEE